MTDPFYLDWKFWSVIVSFIALVLSQLPPIHVMLRPAKLDIEVNSHILLTHGVGNPNAQLYLVISNKGSREIKIKSINLCFERETEDIFTLPAQSYFQSQRGTAEIFLLVSFKIKPNEDWEQSVNFYNSPSRIEEKAYRQIVLNLKNDITYKSTINNDSNMWPADEENVQPFIALFDRRFRWIPGEYSITLEICSEPNKASLKKKYRIILFESDSAELQEYTNEYKYGLGIYLDSTNTGCRIPLTEVEA